MTYQAAVNARQMGAFGKSKILPTYPKLPRAWVSASGHVARMLAEETDVALVQGAANDHVR